jgi:hypothetical protein
VTGERARGTLVCFCNERAVDLQSRRAATAVTEPTSDRPHVDAGRNQLGSGACKNNGVTPIKEDAPDD